MPNVSFTGDASGAVAAAAEAQAAIDAVHGKSVNVDINIRQHGSGGGLGDATSALNRHAAASERASSAARDHASASDRASSSVRDHASASERASSATHAHAVASRDASSALERHAVASGNASGGMRELGDSHRYTRGETQGLTKAFVAGGLASAGFAKSVSGLLDVGERTGGSLGSAARAGAGLSDVMGQLGSTAGTVGGALSTVGMAALYSAAGSGILTAAVGSLGVVGVGSLGAVGVAAGVAGGAMADFAVKSNQDSARFGKSFAQMGKQAHLAAQMISEPMAGAMESLGRSMVGADNRLTPQGMHIATMLREGFGQAASVMEDSSGKIGQSAQVMAGSFARLVTEAAPGARAFLSQLPEMTAGVASGLSQITTEFGNSARQMEGATPSFNRMIGSVGGLGAELMHVGAGSMVAFNEGTVSMMHGLTGMTQKLEPAIKPSMQAFTDTMNSLSGAIGTLSPDIAGFAGTLSRNAPGLQQGLVGIGKGMLGLGSGAMEGVSAAAPALERMGGALERYGPAAGRGAGQAASIVGDIVTGGIQGVGAAQESGESVKSGLDSFLGTTRDSEGRITGWGTSAAGGPARDTMGYAGGWGSSLTGGPARSTWGYMGGASAGGGGGPVFAASWNGPAGAFAGPNGAPTPSGQVQTAQAGAANLFSNMANIPTGVAAAHTALSTLPSAAGGAMQGAHQAIQGANLGGAVQSPMAKMLTKVQDQAAPAAAAGGAVGGAIGGGIGGGVTKTETVIDTIMRKHIAHYEDSGMSNAQAHSPARRFFPLGGHIAAGIGQGVIQGKKNPLAATTSLMDDMDRQAAEARANKVYYLRPGSPLRAGASMAELAGREGPRTGKDKQRDFGEDPNPGNRWGPRMVFDKQVMSYEAKAGQDITQAHTMDDLRGMIQSPLDARQQTAMEGAQDRLDQPGWNRNMQLFGLRTEQNIMRNRPGALDVAGQWADKEAQQEREAKRAGENSTNPILDAFHNAAGPARAYGSALAEAGHDGYKKKDQQNSPSAVWAGMAGNSIAGLTGQFDSSHSAVAGSVTSLTGAMQGVGNDSMLKMGYTWVENVVTGVQVAAKRANFQVAGTPTDLGERVMAGLGSNGLLGPAVGGVSVYKNLAVSFQASSQPQIIRQEINLSLDGDVFRTIAHEIALQGDNRLIEMLTEHSS